LEYTTQTYVLGLKSYLAQGDLRGAESLYEEAKSKGTLTAAISNVYLQHYALEKDMERLMENWLRMEMDGVEPDELSHVLKMKAQFHMNDLSGFYESWEALQRDSPHLVTSMSFNLAALTMAHGKETDRLQVLLSEVDSKFADKAAIDKDPEILQTIILGHGYRGDYTRLTDTMDVMLKDGIRIGNPHCIAGLMGMCAASRATLAEKFVYRYIRKDLIRNKKALNVNLRVLYRMLLAECIEARDAEVATRTFESIVHASVQGDPLAFETKCMVRLHLDRGEEEQANKYLERFLQTVPLTNATPLPIDLVKIYINHYVEHNEPRKALRFWQLHSANVEEGTDKLRLGLEAYAVAGETKTARNLFDKLLETGVLPTPEMCQSVMRAYINANDSKRAIVMFEETQENGVAPNVGSYNLVAGIYASRGDVAKTLGTLESMQQDSVQPNADSYAHVMQVYIATKKWDLALSTFEKYFMPDTSSSPPKSSSSSSPKDPFKEEDEEAQKRESSTSQTINKFQPGPSEYASAFLSASHLNDKKRVAEIWNIMKAKETQLTIQHIMPALTASANQPPLFISILQVLQKRIIKNSFKITYEQINLIGKSIRSAIISQSSPLWQDIDALTQQPGKNQLNWDKKKDWSTLLSKVVFDWMSANPK